MSAQPNAPGPRQNSRDDLLTLQEACRFLRVQKAPCATGATSAADPAASRSAATSATGEQTSSSGSPNRPTVQRTADETSHCHIPKRR